MSQMWTPTWGQADVEIQREDLVYSGFYQVRRYRLRHRCFAGGWSANLVREQFRRADAAAILLWDPVPDKLVLVEQCRIGLLGVYPQQSPWLLEIVAGLLEPGEDPQEAVHREVKEETGCVLIDSECIGQFYNSPGGFAEKTFVFCGVVDSSRAGGIHGVGAEHEDIRVHVLPSASVLRSLAEGQLCTSASTVIALQWLKEHKDRWLKKHTMQKQ